MTTRIPARPRLQRPRDLQVSYVVGRMGAVTVGDVWPLFWGSATMARYGFGRLCALDILRSFPRPAPSAPKWFSLTEPGLRWVAEEAGCAEAELRRLSGLARVNLGALGVRNRFWSALILATRASPSVRLELFRPEWELRRAKPMDVPVVPDALVVFGQREQAASQLVAWMVELDAGSERSAIWRQKSADYTAARSRPELYGQKRWQVLAVVPSERRARSVAEAVVAGGAGAFTSIGLVDVVSGPRVLEPILAPAIELAATLRSPAGASLIDRLSTPCNYPLQPTQGDTLPKASVYP